MADSIIDVSGLVVRAGGRTIAAVAEWRVAKGQAVLLLGPSGSGKTTLMHAISGLIRPTEGTISVAGLALAGMRPAALDRFRGQYFGIVFQTLRLVRALSVEQNLALALALAGKPKDPARIQAVLERLSLGGLAKAKPQRLSVGEGQRAAIARAVVTQPSVILADEPTSALDDGNAQRALELLLSEAQGCGAALVIATHDRRLKDRISDRLELSA
ncbi:MAG: ABC transporter ATP-binding protein [Caulobacterales bacterium]